METFIRFWGWLVSVALLAMAISGFTPVVAAHFGWEVSAFFTLGTFHVRWGLMVSLAALLLYVMPYFYMIGLVAQIGDSGQGDDDSLKIHTHALGLKGNLLLPALFATVAVIGGPILGFLERNGTVPSLTHGIFMTVYIVLHVFVWVQSLYSIRMARQLLSTQLIRD